MDYRQDSEQGNYIKMLAADMAASGYFGHRGASPAQSAARDLRSATDFVSGFIGEVGLPPGGQVLEIGCGNGSVSLAFAYAGFHVCATDYSTSRCTLTNARVGDHGLPVRVVRADGTCLPVKSESQDLVICRNVYEHVGRPANLVAEIARVLKPGALCNLTAPNRWGIGQLIRDEHYHLPLLTVLPRPIAKAYVIRLMKRDAYFILQRVPGYGELRRQLERNHLQWSLLQPDLALVQRKFLEPQTTNRGLARRALQAAKSLRLSGALARLATGEPALKYAYSRWSLLLTKAAD